MIWLIVLIVTVLLIGWLSDDWSNSVLSVFPVALALAFIGVIWGMKAPHQHDSTTPLRAIATTVDSSWSFFLLSGGGGDTPEYTYMEGDGVAIPLQMRTVPITQATILFIAEGESPYKEKECRYFPGTRAGLDCRHIFHIPEESVTDMIHVTLPGAKENQP